MPSVIPAIADMLPENDEKQADGEIDRVVMQRLRKLIGRDCAYVGKACLIVDILADQGALVLEARERLPPIQGDQYGRAAYRSNELLQIPIFGSDKTSLSEEIMDLFATLNDRDEDVKSDPE